jgi:AcrR family transcriptional regulator
MSVDRASQRVPRALPRGRNPAPRHVVLLSQRTRLLEAVFAAVAAKGYSATTVADITRIAAVSRATFYEQFSDKLACYLAAYEAAGEELHAAVRDASSLVDDPIAALRAGDRAYLRFLEADRGRTRAALVETVAAGPRALELRQVVDGRFVRMLRGLHDVLRETRPEVPELPDRVLCAVVAAGNELVVQQLLADDPLPELEDDMVRLQLAVLGAPAG